MADDVPSTRRTAFATMAAVAITPFAPPHFMPAPTERGRALLQIIGILRRNWRSAPDERTEPVSFAVFEGYARVLHRAANQLAGEIAAQPLHTMGDLIDRAIVLAWGRADVPMDILLDPILALGGVEFALCEHHECREVA